MNCQYCLRHGEEVPAWRVDENQTPVCQECDKELNSMDMGRKVYRAQVHMTFMVEIEKRGSSPDANDMDLISRIIYDRLTGPRYTHDQLQVKGWNVCYPDVDADPSLLTIWVDVTSEYE